MPSDKENDATQASEPLYAWWLNLLPSLLGGLVPKMTMPVEASEEPSATLPLPAAEISQALALTRQLLEPLFQQYMKALTLNPNPDQAFGAFQSSIQDSLRQLSEGFSGIGKMLSPLPTSIPSGAWNLMGGQPAALFGQALKPMATNLERAYGGLADAFGLAPMRDLQGAARGMASATLAKQQAQAEYLGLVVAALAKGSEGLVTRLQEMGRNGESVDSLLGLVRLWSRSAEDAMHAAMQSPKALEASAKLVRAGARSRQQQHRIVALASEALNVPTRAEVDDAYREIQELKREVRRLRKSIEGPRAVAVAAAQADTIDQSEAAVPKPKPARAPAAKRKTASKVAAS